MHGLVLAGGEGSRLAAAGVSIPKPLVEVVGKPQVARLLETLDGLGCDSLTCAVNADFPAVGCLLATVRFQAPLRVLECRTPSSLHTLVAGLAVVPPGPVFCTMVDTVMPAADWRRLFRGVTERLDGGAAAALAVTPFVDDELPLYVTRDTAGFATAILDTPPSPGSGLPGLGT